MAQASKGYKMIKLRNWFLGTAASIGALFAVHTVQPTQIEIVPVTPVAIASPTPTATPSNTINAYPNISIGKVTALDSEQAMIAQGKVYANAVLQSDCFKASVVASQFTENNGLTGAQIYAKQVANPVTVNVVMYTATWWANNVSKTIGYETDPYDGTVYMNRLRVNSAYMVGDNLMHEGEGHSQGFTHYQVKSTSEPYGMNTTFEKCAPGLGIEE